MEKKNIDGLNGYCAIQKSELPGACRHPCCRPGLCRRAITKGYSIDGCLLVCGSRLSSTTSNQSPDKAVEPDEVHKESKQKCVLACVHMYVYRCAFVHMQLRGYKVGSGNCIRGARKQPRETMCKEAIMSLHNGCRQVWSSGDDTTRTVVCFHVIFFMYPSL